MAMKKSVSTTIEIPAVQMIPVKLRIVGDSPLIVHNWDEKAKLMILGKQQKKATSAKGIRRPAVEFANSLYWLTEKPNFDGLTDEEVQEILSEVIPKSKFGFPSLAFKSAGIDAAYQQKFVPNKTTLRGAIHVIDEFTVIEGTPRIREDPVKIGMGTADLRYRAEFPAWETTLNIKYFPGAISLAQVINVINLGGSCNGVGERRPSKSGGNCGTYHVESST